MGKEIMGKVKDEPTREQIKEAFKKTIERWEKIVEDVGYYECSDCPLCSLFPGATCEKKICPVGIYAKRGACNDTPYWDFTHDKTPENALAELNFLRKVYIWWMEKEANKIFDKVAMYGKEEKKEEWENLTTKDLVVLIKECGEQAGCYLVITDNDGFRLVAKRETYIDKENYLHMTFYRVGNPKYKVNVENGNFRILKKT